jgi:hypothetical protein
MRVTDDEINDRLAEADEAIQLRDVLVAGLAGAAADLSDMARELVKATVLSKTQRAVFGLVILLGAVGLIVSSIGLVLLLQGADEARLQRREILSCTTPAGTCYQRGQQQTADAVLQLNRVTVAAVQCAQTQRGDRAIEACITAKVTHTKP